MWERKARNNPDPTDWYVLRTPTIFAYRGANAPLLCSYCGMSTSHETINVQAHVVYDLLTLEVYIEKKLLIENIEFEFGGKRLQRDN